MRRAMPVVAAVLGLAATASAMVVLEVALADLSRTSSLIVHAKVASVQARAAGDERNIVTDVALDVEEVLKGNLREKRFAFTLPGGRLGKYELAVPGLPRFHAGEEVVVFLEAIPRGGYTVCGMSQGKFTVGRDERTGRAFVRRSLEGMGLARRGPGGMEISHPAPDAGAPVALDEFLGQVRALVSVQATTGY